MKTILRHLIAVALAVAVSSAGVAQDRSVDLNRYYYYPGSIGFAYRQVTPFAEFASSFIVHEFTGTGRIPLPTAPYMTGLLRAGVLQYDSQDEADPEKWDHSHFYATPGFGIAHRISKEFEIGADAAVGLSQSLFANAADEPVGSLNLVAAATAKLSLNPSFNVSIDVTPALRYIRPFSPFTTYGGLSFGLGIAAHYRFGRDPDSAESLIRALRFSEIELPDVFAAMQSYYVDNPIGSVTFTNTERYPLEDVAIAFFQNGYMDTPTPSASIGVIEPGETVTVELLASFNDEVFSREGITPLNGEVIATYTARGRPAEQRQPVTYDMHDRTALTWDDDRKVAAFITPADSALRNYASFIRRAGAEHTVSGLSDEVQVAMQLYHGLAELDLYYQEDPTSPFTRVQEDQFLVDSISLPRDTLTRSTGDCDDLTVLYASLLESLGIETGFITVPGHIYAAFNTGIASREYARVHPDRSMVLDVDGVAWLPVEVTLIGRESFVGAWRTGIDLWEQAGSSDGPRAFHLTSDAQSVYRPVGLRERDLGLQYGDTESVVASFVNDRERMVDTIITPLRDEARRDRSARSWNTYGIAAARYHRYDEAAGAFRDASLRDPDLLSPRINLGSVSYLRGDYRTALNAYLDAERLLRARGRDSGSNALAKVLVNISKTHYALGSYEEAENYFARATEESPEIAEEFAYLRNVASDGTARASDLGRDGDILFVEDE